MTLYAAVPDLTCMLPNVLAGKASEAFSEQCCCLNLQIMSPSQKLVVYTAVSLKAAMLMELRYDYNQLIDIGSCDLSPKSSHLVLLHQQ